jgi:hypothetical protein
MDFKDVAWNLKKENQEKDLSDFFTEPFKGDSMENEMGNMSVNALREKMVDLAEKKEALKNQMKLVSEELNNILGMLGVGESFQDAKTGIVYKVTKPTGTYVEFKQIDYVRTRKQGEAKGSLSKTEAKSLGFEVE